MVTDTHEYKGRKFQCHVCGYVVSSNAMTDFDVDDFEYCPCCGKLTNMSDWDYFHSFLESVCIHFESMKTWSDKDKLNETVRAIEKEISRLREQNLVN